IDRRLVERGSELAHDLERARIAILEILDRCEIELAVDGSDVPAARLEVYPFHRRIVDLCDVAFRRTSRHREERDQRRREDPRSGRTTIHQFATGGLRLAPLTVRAWRPARRRSAGR